MPAPAATSPSRAWTADVIRDAQPAAYPVEGPDLPPPIIADSENILAAKYVPDTDRIAKAPIVPPGEDGFPGWKIARLEVEVTELRAENARLVRLIGQGAAAPDAAKIADIVSAVAPKYPNLHAEDLPKLVSAALFITRNRAEIGCDPKRYGHILKEEVQLSPAAFALMAAPFGMGCVPDMIRALQHADLWIGKPQAAADPVRGIEGNAVLYRFDINILEWAGNILAPKDVPD